VTDQAFGPPPIHAMPGFSQHIDPLLFPAEGMAADEAYELMHTGLMLDGQPTLNLASFVTTWM
jgi:glutamate decarboxylase